MRKQKNKPKRFKTYLEYLESCPGKKEYYTHFSNQKEADEFGEGLRQNLCKELECGYYELDTFVEVRISQLAVRCYFVKYSKEESLSLV